MHRRFLAFLVLLAVVIGARTPFFDNVLIGEEGCFAFLLFNPVPSAKLTKSGRPECLVGQIDGRFQFASFEKAVTPLLLLEEGVGRFTRGLGVLDMPPHQRSTVARLSFFALFLIGTAGMIWIAAAPLAASGPLAQRLLAPAVMLYAMTSPLAVGASIQPQLDGSVGVLLAGLAAWLLVAARSSQAAVALAGLLAGLGRHEWSLAFGAAAFATMALGIALRAPTLRCSLLFIFGLAAGNAVSLALSPEDYRAGFHLISRIAGRTEGPDLLTVTLAKARFTAPLAALIGAASVVFAFHLRHKLAQQPGVALVLLTAIFLSAGFLLSGWPGDGFPRYFAPAMVLAAYGLVALIRDGKMPRRAFVGAAVALVTLGLAFNARYLEAAARKDVSITTNPSTPLAYVKWRYALSAVNGPGEHALAAEYAGFWFYHPGTSFLSPDVPAAITFPATADALAHADEARPN